MLQDKFGLPVSYSSTTLNPLVHNFNPDVDSGPSNVRPEPGLEAGQDVDQNSLSDVVATLMSAILALTFLLLLFCIIRIIRKRRRQLQGQRLNQPVIQTISSGAFTASTAAYSHHVPTAGGISWERVDTQARSEPSRPCLLSTYNRLSSSHPSLEPHHYQFSDSSSPPIQSFQASLDLQFPGTSTSLSTTETVQSCHRQQEMLQLSASPAPSSNVHMVQVDAVLHHASSPEVLGASGTSASFNSSYDSPLPSLPPPLFGSSYHQWRSLHEHDTPGNEPCGAPVEQARPLRTIVHQHRPSQ
ncbi:hypothetical protein ElyMa_003773300 [Elysia marginata]|uniref:Uncharacterized protein n=1 Tax=Elysia marginata TaxID=1093978 RepID=A0AAV4FAG2_9GAST|nr:hypothetical protein ElyMa_003773300 [Elysia marginata]